MTATAMPQELLWFNAYWKPLTFWFQAGLPGEWKRSIDTARDSPLDICEAGEEPRVLSDCYEVDAHSVVVLIC